MNDHNTIEKKLKDLLRSINHKSFLFDLLSIYDFPKAFIERLKKGDGNLSKNEGEYLSKRKFLFKAIQDNDPHLVIDELGSNESLLKHKPRFLIVTDYKTFLAQDLQTYDSLDIPIKDLAENHEFFFPWMGREKSKFVNEALADIRAASKMGELYDLILENNPTFVTEKDKKHSLNMFFAQLLFCFFAEDTGLFENNTFTNTIADYSDVDGSNLSILLRNIFQSLEAKDKTNFPPYCKNLPYVGGNLFEGDIDFPIFTRKARANIIQAGKLDWHEINPDIFGSMIQVISSPEERALLGEHYTSVPNIMKVINPLFMDSLNEQFANCDSEKDYEKLLKRIYALKIFDPASGSGNFLIVTYKQLCKLELKIFSALQEINSSKWTLASLGIRASQFYALTIQDFDAQIAKLSMYISEHQMNQELSDIFGEISPTLPFSNTLNIEVKNSLREDWGKIFDFKEEDNLYIIGNPPFKGAMKQSDFHKADLKYLLKDKYKAIDYIFGWFLKASQLIEGRKNYEFAFVSTNSVSQGEQVGIAWPMILNDILEISFAYKSFIWKNNASKNAGVTVIIIGIRNSSAKPKYLFENNNSLQCKNISPTLSSSVNIIVKSSQKPLFNVPEMNFGNMPADGGTLILSEHEKNEILSKDEKYFEFIRPLVSAKELLKGQNKWCFWLKGYSFEKLMEYPVLKERIIKNKEIRLDSSRPKLAEIPHLFGQITQPEDEDFILVPRVSSENRNYIPLTRYEKNYISNDTCLVIGSNDLSLMAQLSSKAHMVWMRNCAGRLKNDYRYSAQVVYNNYPFINMQEEEKNQAQDLMLEILDLREKYSEMTLGKLYHKDSMPNDLFTKHKDLDRFIENLYNPSGFKSDEEIMLTLYNLYRDKINA